MKNKVNDIHVVNSINLLHTPRDEGNQNNKAASRKMGLRYFPMNFHGCVSFIMSQNVYLALILDHF